MEDETEQTLAARYYRAYATFHDIEDEIVEKLSAAGVDVEDFTADHYDESIEIYGLVLSVSDVVLDDTLRQMGFKLVWVHAPECKPPDRGCKCPARSLR